MSAVKVSANMESSSTDNKKCGTYLADYLDDDYDGNVFGATMGVEGLKKDLKEVYYASTGTKPSIK